MAKRKKKNPTTVSDYRHEQAKRKNNPPAKIAAEGTVPVMPKIEYSYNPRRPPVLQFDPDGQPDKLPELLAEATRRLLTPEEAKLVADALCTQQPWLEWAEKREQHQRGGFAVDPVALHIHERVSAQAILKVAARQDVERTLFGDPEQEYHEAVQFYRHDIDWTNRLILGDSLQVMASLAHREDLAGKVQMIYIDPPYGIKFGSNFQPEIGSRNVTDREQDLTREPEMVKAYRDTWRLGLHSYLSCLRDWLTVAKELLADTGSIFLQMGDENLNLVGMVLDEVFGRHNFLRIIGFKKSGAQSTDKLPSNFDFILWYAKDATKVKARPVTVSKDETGAIIGQDIWEEFSSGELRRASVTRLADAPPEVNLFTHRQVASPGATRTGSYPLHLHGRAFKPPANRHWSVPESDMRRLIAAERLFIIGNSVRGKEYVDRNDQSPLGNVWTDTSRSGFADPLRYVVETSTKVIQRCILMTTDPGDLVLDPTCGSGTTAYVAEQWGRRWITIDTSRVAVALARQRLLTAKVDRYRVKGEDESGNGNANHHPGVDPHPGFVYKTVPHITLGSIARNETLDPIFAKHEPILEDKLAACNKALKDVTPDLWEKLEKKIVTKKREEGVRSITEADLRRWRLPNPPKGKWEDGPKQFEHWTVPFDIDPDWPKSLQQAVTEYRKAWRAKMDEVNACIAANADQEELVDQPEVVRGVVRVSGPFTVEAVQPPELSLGEVTYEGPAVFAGEPEELEGTFMQVRPVEPRSDFEVKNVEAYLDQMTRLLRMDGVRFPNNRQMHFTRLERTAGISIGIHAEGRWVPEGEDDPDPDGQALVAVAFGPQYGPVTALQVEELLRATSRRGYTDLVFAGFSFDGPAQELIDSDPNPHVRIHRAHIRPDVNPAMAGLLKEQPGSQLFTVFGQPRTTVNGPDKKGEYVVRMEGVDIYNPVTNTISSTGAEKVAAWFVDGDYDGRTFCITQAFFPDRSAWKKLARALKGVLDDEAFEAFSGTESLPFPAGNHKYVAVKVIDPRGNEVMQVHRLE